MDVESRSASVESEVPCRRRVALLRTGFQQKPGSPQFAQRALDKAAALATVARLSQTVAPPVPAEDARPLPKCKDRDDQKFLELAYAAGADWLVSKDRAVLKLARRVARDFGFQIAQPAPFVAACALPAETAAETAAHA